MLIFLELKTLMKENDKKELNQFIKSIFVDLL